MSGLRQVFKKLFTKEDPHFLHKFFGFLSLASFVYRYQVVFRRTGVLGLSGAVSGKWGDHLAWATMAVHLALSTSSLIFHVLRARILSKPTIIWHEYRLHAIVFTLRCVSVFLFARLSDYALGPAFRGSTVGRVLLLPVVLSHHLLADEVTRRHGPSDKTQTTVRVQDDQPVWGRAVLRFYGFYQFAALGSHLLPHARSADLGYNSLIAIQSSAFLMTLVRKGLVRSMWHGIIYTACLLLSLYHIWLCFPSLLGFWAKVLAAYALRVGWLLPGVRCGKYKIWTVFVLASMPWVQRQFFDSVQAFQERYV